MKQPTRNRKTGKWNGRASKKEGGSVRYGVSKLEMYFAHNFLDKLGLDYIYEYEAKDIGRFYDFAVIATIPKTELIMEEKNGINAVSQHRNSYRIKFMCEIDGGFWHGDPRLVGRVRMTNMQKRNRLIDKMKDNWCESHHMVLLRIWEYDIKNNPNEVMDGLRKILSKLDKGERLRYGMHRIGNKSEKQKKRPHQKNDIVIKNKKRYIL